MLPNYFVVIGTLITAAGAISYLIDTIKGSVKPNRVSFLLWGIFPTVAFIAQLKQGIGMESLLTFSVGFLAFLILGASFVNKQAEWKITQFDLVCGVLSLCGLILWLITRNANMAILFSILADGLACVPTIVKAYRYPETEAAWPWMCTVVGVTLTLLTLSEFTFANSAFIIYILVANLVIFSVVYSKIGPRLARESLE